MSAAIVMLTIGLRPDTDLVAQTTATNTRTSVAVTLGDDTMAPALSARLDAWPDLYRRLGEALTSAGVDLTAVTP